MKKTAWTSMALSMMICFVLCGMDAFAQAPRGAGVPPEKLPKEMREISPRDYFIPSSQKQVGVIHAMEGAVVVLHGTTGEAYFGMAGDTVYEKDSLTTLLESKCRIRFLDEDVVTMGPGTEFSVESFEDQRAQGTKSSFFRMIKGKAMFYALRLFRYRDTRFSLATPTTTIGVRGTKFGAEVYYLEPGRTADRGILVADGRNEIAPYLLAQAGMQWVTNCFSMDGTVSANGLVVGPGEYYNSQTNAVNPTPPNLLLQFLQNTQIGGGTPAPGPTSGGDQITPPGAQTTTGPAIAEIQSNISSQVQTQTQQTVLLEANRDITSLPGPLEGYFSLLLTKNGSFYDAFLNTSRQRTDVLEDYTLNGLMEMLDYLKVNGPSGVPTTGVAKLGLDNDSGIIDNPPTKTYIGQGTYTQWGYWSSPNPTTFTPAGSANEYQFVTDRFWFLEGNNVFKQADIANIKTGTYGYSGNAYGTYFGPDGSAQLSGSFRGNVNIGTASSTVDSINIDVRGTDAKGVTHSAILQQITPVTISFGTSPTPGNSFHLDSASLTGTIDNNSAGTYKAVNGSIYGPNAEEVGGNWGVADSPSGKGAAGVFQGKR